MASLSIVDLDPIFVGKEVAVDVVTEVWEPVFVEMGILPNGILVNLAECFFNDCIIFSKSLFTYLVLLHLDISCAHSKSECCNKSMVVPLGKG